MLIPFAAIAFWHFLYRGIFMKTVSLTLARSAVACIGLFSCSYKASYAQTFHPWFKEEISPPAREASVDDYLIELSKALPANCILDATDIDPQERVKPFPGFVAAIEAKWSTARLNVLYDFRGQASLSEQALGDNGTLLFWRQPDPVEGARLSLQGREADDALLEEAKAADEGVPGPAVLSEYKPLQEKWAKYWREVHGWDGKSPKVDITVKVADLPPDLRALVEAQVRQTVYGALNTGVSTFSDEFWDSLRLVVETAEYSPNPAKKIFYLSYWTPLLPQRRAFRFGSLNTVLYALQNQEPTPAARPTLAAVPNTTTLPAPLIWPDKFAARLFGPEMENDAALQAKVSLEAKRRLLQVLVGDLKKQSGVALAVAPGVASAKAPVTLRVSEMPLWKMMAALSRIYGLTWIKDGASYTLRPAKLSPLDAQMLRLGFGYRSPESMETTSKLREREQNALAREIVRHVNRAQLNSPQGAPLRDVPDELRDRMRQLVEDEAARSLVGKQGNLDATPLEGLTLRFARLNIRGADKTMWGRSAFTGENAQMGAFTADGRFLCIVFERFRARAPLVPLEMTPPMPPDWKPGDPATPYPEGWKLGDPFPPYPPGWKKGDAWPTWPKTQDAPPPGAPAPQTAVPAAQGGR